MQAILLEDIRGLGEAGNVVTVARGYMRNYLEPRRLAEVATPAKIAEVQRTAEQRAHEKRRKESKIIKGAPPQQGDFVTAAQSVKIAKFKQVLRARQ